MKSNKSLFSATLFKSNIVRFLPFSILFTIIELVIFPLILFFNYSRKYNADFSDLFGMGVASDVFTGIFAVVFAILIFGYLFSANKSIALHSFPIGRKALFTTNFISAYVLLVVPQLVGFVLALPGMIMFTKAEIFKAFLLLHLPTIFLFSFIVLSIAVLAMMLSGNAFAGLIIYGILNFLYTAVVMLLSYAVSFFGYGLNETVIMNDGYSYILSPAVELFSRMSEYEEIMEKGKTIVELNPTYFAALGIYFAVAIAICALAYLLYKCRELEVAGEMAAFEKELPFIRVIVSVIGATVIAMSIGSIINAGKVGMIILYVVFSFIVYFATQMILKRKFNIFSGKLIIRWAVCCAVSVGVVLGLAAYETNYIPEASRVDKASVNMTYEIEADGEKGTQQFRELQKELIKYSKENNAVTGFRSATDYAMIDYADEESLPDKLYLNIQIDYTLKNGKEVSRVYEYNGESKKINALIKAIETENEYQNMFDYLDEIGVKYTVKGISVDSYENEYSEEYTVYAKDYETFIALCKEDIATLTDNYSSLTPKKDSYSDVWIECVLDKNVKKDVLDVLTDGSYSNFVEGYFSYDNYDDGYPGVFDIHISTLPENSKVMQFVKEHQE